MISFNFLKTAERFLVDNAPTILTAVGVVGTGATAYLTHRASYEAANIIRSGVEDQTLDHKNKTEVVKLTWKLYVPPVAAGVTTIGCIVFAHRMNSKRLAALALAYSLSEKKYDDYKDKVKETFGVKKEEKVRDDIAQDKVTESADRAQLIITGDAEVLFLDTLSGRYFKNDIETVRRAENEINQQIILDHCANVTEFYEKIGLKSTGMSDYLGWRMGNHLELIFSTAQADNGRPCIVIDYNYKPIQGYKDRDFDDDLGCFEDS